MAFSFGTGGAASSTGTSAGFSFGGTGTATTSAASTSASAAPSLGGFSFGSKSTSGSSFSLGGSTTTTASTTTTPAAAATTAAPSLFGNTATPATTTSAPAVSTSAKPGLGGSGYAAATESTNKDAAAPVPVKQQMLPAEIAELVKGLEGHIKKEKEESSEVAKYSQRTLNKIKENASSLEILIRSLKSNLQRENSTVEKLCQTASKLQKNVEMAQRTNDTHAALQHENILPTRYFAELVVEFEQKLAIYRSQIDMLESHLAAGGQQALVELPQTLERLHQTFIALAAGLQIILTNMDKLKQRYLDYRRQVLGDTNDVFQKKKAKISAPIKGPSPFAELSNLSLLAVAQLQAAQTTQNPPTQNQPSLFGQTKSNTNSGGLFGNTSSNTGSGGLFGNTSSNTTTGGGLFGNTSTNTGSTGGLFGNTSNTNQNKSTFSFGNSSTSTSTTGGGLFGNTTTTTSGGTSLFGNTSSGTSAFSFGKK